MFHPFPLRKLSRVCLVSVVLALGKAAPVFAESSSEAPSVPIEIVPEWESVFSDYEAFETQPVLSWPRLNRRVAEIGGWRTYAMEPYEDEAAEAEPSEERHDNADHSGHSGGHP
ncbi:hypothetical protein [Allohahella marinimesophila]|uniref:Secreted protein n=1 Tax=Allohahella marinimesophila TaxID=1054972 RepID=A0ABP7NKL6_9GAMM